jgi:hypothetical protein
MFARFESPVPPLFLTSTALTFDPCDPATAALVHFAFALFELVAVAALPLIEPLLVM